jgi:hypothetical protein
MRASVRGNVQRDSGSVDRIAAGLQMRRGGAGERHHPWRDERTCELTVQHRSRSAARIALAMVAVGAGLAIALVDASPGWDSTGITAGALVTAAGIIAFVGRDRPWLWALLIGLPTPAIEIVGAGSTGSLLALGFAAAGAAIGWGLARAR